MVRRRPPSSVLRRTLASTGRVLLLETARLTTPRPRARFSCMTESFTSVHSMGGAVREDSTRGLAAQGSRLPQAASSVCVSSLILLDLVITIIMLWKRVDHRARPRSGGPVHDGRRAVDAARRPGAADRDNRWINRPPAPDDARTGPRCPRRARRSCPTLHPRCTGPRVLRPHRAVFHSDSPTVDQAARGGTAVGAGAVSRRRSAREPPRSRAGARRCRPTRG